MFPVEKGLLILFITLYIHVVDNSHRKRSIFLGLNNIDGSIMISNTVNRIIQQRGPVFWGLLLVIELNVE